MKSCKHKECKEVNPQPLSAFDKQKTGDGYRNICKKCRDTQRRIRHSKNKEKWNSYMREFNKTHPKSAEFKDRLRYKLISARYGISKLEYDEMFISQGRRCAICDKEQKRHLVVDHCHETGKVRGLLCFKCNVSMAAVDEVGLLDKLLKYKDKSIT